jgi:hypothetical protein
VNGDTAFEQDETVDVQFSGDSLTSDVTATGTIVNDDNVAPVAVDDSATTDEDTAVEVDVLSNDTDENGDSLSVSSASATNGSVVVNDDNTLTYTPNSDFNGDDTITYEVSDGNGGSDTGSVDVTVNPVNDAPEITSSSTVSSPVGPMRRYSGLIAITASSRSTMRKISKPQPMPIMNTRSRLALQMAMVAPTHRPSPSALMTLMKRPARPMTM